MTSANGLVVANTVTVTPGATATMLLSQMPKGTQILNLDSTRSIWVSDNQSVVPGIGYQIGPLGSCVWQYDGQPAYACVDTGVTTPVSVTFGNSVSDVTNPVFVAEALAILGIPNVLVEDALNNNNPYIIPTGNNTPQIDVHKYASLIIVSNLAPSVNAFILEYQWFDVAGHPCGSGELTCPPSQVVPPWQIPVQGATVEFINLGNGTISLSVDGTNRSVDRATMLNDNLILNAFALNQAYVIGSQYNLGTLYPPNGKANSVALDMTLGPGLKGLFQLADAIGNVFQLADNTQFRTRTDTFQQFNMTVQLPPVPLTILFACMASGSGLTSLVAAG